MADAKPQPEPSMEEIIASISRIIAEDGKAAGPTAAAVAGKTDILDLTEAVNEDGSVRRIRPAGPPPIMAETSKDAASAGASARIEPEPPSVVGSAGSAAGGHRDAGPLLSEATSEATASAFAGLGAVPRTRRNERGPVLVGGERTLDEIVRDTLRPLLQEWLDQHLAGIVERLVRDEIARVTGEAGLR
jgi:cell pole-organizing protein PopZ